MANIDKILSGNLVPNHYPFFWLSGSETIEDVVQSVKRAKSYGCSGITVEPRGFRNFHEGWWPRVDAILKTAKEIGLKVMFVDEDTHCPTGHVFDKVDLPGNEHLRRRSLVEEHVDIIGPRTVDIVVGYSMPFNRNRFSDNLMGVYAYKRTDNNNGIDISNPIDLTNNVKDGIISCSIPEGNYRIVKVYNSVRFSEIFNNHFIDLANDEAVDLLINYIYNEYERRYKEYFNNTIIGFFSDEPSIGNAYQYSNFVNKNHEETRIGTPGKTLPYNEKLYEELEKIYGKDTVAYIPALWYWDENISPKIRNDYMDILSKLYQTCFTEKVGKWCADRGLIYIGHVLEDANLHTRIGDGPVHYFRSQMGQTMPGMDIVLHQVMPGFADVSIGAAVNGIYGNEFYHYILGKLHSSMAHTYEKFNNKCMCEVTIGYGWAEGSQIAKWLMDYLMVRGTNFFVTGALRPRFPDEVHAPHFGDNDGKEPQESGYVKLIDYSAKVVSALDGGTHIANALILYHARGEWMNDTEYMFMERPAKVLYDNHIDFDILSEDLLDSINIENGKCKIIETYDCIVVPYAKNLPSKMICQLQALKNKGADIVFVDGLPQGASGFKVVELEKIADYFVENNYVDVRIDGFKTLRHYHVQKDGVDTYLFFNESGHDVFDGEIYTGKTGNYNVYDFISNNHRRGISGNAIKLRLEPFQSCVVVYEQDRGFIEYLSYDELKTEKVNAEFNLTLYSHEHMKNMDEVFTTYKQTDLVAVSSKYPTFSGKIVYDAKINLKKSEQVYIRLKNVGENAELYLNGVDCGLLISRPFIFDVTKAVKDGENDIKIEVKTTLANSERDPVSMYVPMEPTGISGGIQVLYK